jgi:hypothetical protein
MERFPHLNLIQKIQGSARLYGGGKPTKQSQENIENRVAHSSYLTTQTNAIESFWDGTFQKRREEGLPELDPNIIPLYLQVDKGFDIEDAFNSFNIEVISEENDGFVIGASLDKLQGLKDKIDIFTKEQGRSKDKAAQLWQIIDGTRWRVENILSSDLLTKWDSINLEYFFTVDVGIACYKPVRKKPKEGKGYKKRFAKYQNELEVRDEFFMQRQSDFERFIKAYSGRLLSSYYENIDSFACRLSISGKGLKDLVLNYQYVFEVTEPSEIEGAEKLEAEIFFTDLTVLAPISGSPQIVVIDSGIQENHKLLEVAINKEKSISYLPEETSTADFVSGGGHGTRVAGAILYPNGVSGLAEIQLPCFIRNIRVLDRNNGMPDSIYPPTITHEIVKTNSDCRLFNLSITDNTQCTLKHMSQWAATIDKLIHEKDVLFIVSAGNINFEIIQTLLNTNEGYPNYLSLPECKIANPSQSCFAITVGSINHGQYEDIDRISMGQANEVSPFSRNGLGIWGMVKPDVVEYGGGLIQTKLAPYLISIHDDTTPELIRSTMDGGQGVGHDAVGTSFATPKVTSIASELLKLYPDENINILRALIAQSARHPVNSFENPTIRSFEQLGYGIPSFERATSNNPYRITFYNTSHIQATGADIYTLNIPKQLRSPGDEFNILIEVTLSYTAKTRRTRQRTQSYLSTWLSWISSKKEESFDMFKNAALNVENGFDSQARRKLDDWPWKIRERSDWGEVKDLGRNKSTLQKDWAIVKSYDLPEELSFAIQAHEGWDKNSEKIPYAFVVSIEVLGSSIEIYELIRIENEVHLEVQIQ